MICHQNVSGKVTLSILGSDGKVVSKKVIPVVLSAFDRSALSTEVTLPGKPGGYLLTAEFKADGSNKSVLSRRFIKVGKLSDYKFYEMQPAKLN